MIKLNHENITIRELDVEKLAKISIFDKIQGTGMGSIQRRGERWWRNDNFQLRIEMDEIHVNFQLLLDINTPDDQIKAKRKVLDEINSDEMNIEIMKEERNDRLEVHEITFRVQRCELDILHRIVHELLHHYFDLKLDSPIIFKYN